jgi:hypothetical protein
MSTTTAVKLLNSDFSYSWQNMISNDPTNTAFDKTEVQFSGWENPLINLTFHIPIDLTIPSTMTWALWNQFVKNEYDGSANTQIKLSMVVGSTDTSLVSYATSSSTASIPVQIKGYSLRISPTDSNGANFWTINAQLIETKLCTLNLY